MCCCQVEKVAQRSGRRTWKRGKDIVVNSMSFPLLVLWPSEKWARLASVKICAIIRYGRIMFRLFFYGYWALKIHDAQSYYITTSVKETEAKRSRVKHRESRCKSSWVFTVVHNNISHVVCMTAFLNIHDISEKRVWNVLCKGKASVSGTITSDQRGRKQPPNKTNQELLDLVQEFCKNLPTCQSHYSRAKNPEAMPAPGIIMAWNIYCFPRLTEHQ